MSSTLFRLCIDYEQVCKPDLQKLPGIHEFKKFQNKHDNLDPTKEFDDSSSR